MQKRAVKRVATDVDALRESVLQSMNSDMQIRDALRLENAELTEKIELNIKRVTEREAEIANLDARMREISARCAEMEKDCDKHRNERDEAKNNLADLEMMYIKKSAELKAEYGEEEAKTRKNLALIKSELDKSSKKLVDSEEKATSFLAEYESMKRDISKMDTDIKLSENKLGGLKSEIQSKETEIEGLKSNIGSMIVENTRLTNLGKEIRNEISLLGDKKESAIRATNLTEHEKRKKEIELTAIQNKMFGLIKREARVNELIPQIKELCERIGIDPKL